MYLGKVVLFGQKWLYSGKVVVFVKYGYNRARWLNSEKVFLFWTKVFGIGVNVAVFGQSGCIRAKVVVFGQKWLNSGKVVVFG